MLDAIANIEIEQSPAQENTEPRWLPMSLSARMRRSPVDVSCPPWATADIVTYRLGYLVARDSKAHRYQVASVGKPVHIT